MKVIQELVAHFERQHKLTPDEVKALLDQGLLASDAPARIQDASLESLMHRIIETGAHCFGCTAGAGSSCGGAVVR